jgi:RimJ/RimL family protein N-acetyltransferase
VSARPPLAYRGDLVVEDALVGIRPLVPADVAALYEIETAEEIAPSWRLGGRTVGLAEYGGTLFGGAVTCQRVIYARRTGALAGLATAYDHHPVNRVVWVSVVAAPGTAGAGLALAGMRVFVAWLFDSLAVRKVYADASGPALARYRGLLRRGFAVEAVLPRYYRTPALTSDRTIFSTTPEAFADAWL